MIYRALGMSRSELLYGIETHNLNEIPAHLVPVAELWAPLAFADFAALKAHLTHRGIPIKPVGTRCPCITRAAARALLAEQEANPVLRERPPGMVTQHELMRRWNMAQSRVQERLKGLPFRRLRDSSAGGLLYLYDERDAARVAPPIGPKSPPRGYVGAGELAGMTGRTTEALCQWAKLGCPHIRTRSGGYCYRVEEVAAWLLACRDPRKRRTGRWLSQQVLSQQKAA
ncbi:hypothetical protein DEIPH_ctg011orf0042 [Deinococcus phoenicis]|uniref:DNA-binding protein n=1 Tax=Deinococcus phoenicis TaxID=1476583 RepID=A0A016QSL3_9DEIO|nr:hypothetical protein [Deinococcus phoenicis]EYB69075.1 hypothetical protein DEIPH_ctg011orf0042 [Deinococcus phoenicis]